MMKSFDPRSPPPNPGPASPRDDDPFAKLNLDGQKDPAGLNVPTADRIAPPRPATTAPPQARPATTTPPAAAPTQAPTPARPPGPPSMVAEVGSWLVVVVGLFSAGAGAVFAGWTSEALTLDATLMPTFERTFGVRPPASFTGQDDVPLDGLRLEAKAREDAGDLPAAAVLWRRVAARDEADATAKAAVPRVMTALGERLR